MSAGIFPEDGWNHEYEMYASLLTVYLRKGLFCTFRFKKEETK